MSRHANVASSYYIHYLGNYWLLLFGTLQNIDTLFNVNSLYKVNFLNSSIFNLLSIFIPLVYLLQIQCF